jgi:hypothetical protein
MSVMNEAKGKGEMSATSRSAPIRVRLPGFIRDEEIGLGDTIRRATYAVGLTPCGGCERRSAALNRWVVFTR